MGCTGSSSSADNVAPVAQTPKPEGTEEEQRMQRFLDQNPGASFEQFKEWVENGEKPLPKVEKQPEKPAFDSAKDEELRRRCSTMSQEDRMSAYLDSYKGATFDQFIEWDAEQLETERKAREEAENPNEASASGPDDGTTQDEKQSDAIADLKAKTKAKPKAQKAKAKAKDDVAEEETTAPAEILDDVVEVVVEAKIEEEDEVSGIKTPVTEDKNLTEEEGSPVGKVEAKPDPMTPELETNEAVEALAALEEEEAEAAVAENVDNVAPELAEPATAEPSPSNKSANGHTESAQAGSGDAEAATPEPLRLAAAQETPAIAQPAIAFKTFGGTDDLHPTDGGDVGEENRMKPSPGAGGLFSCSACKSA